MRDFFSFIEKHAISVIVVILAITVFFLINAFNIRLNGNYTAFFPYGEANRTYYGGKSGQIPDLGIDDDLVEKITVYPLMLLIDDLLNASFKNFIVGLILAITPFLIGLITSISSETLPIIFEAKYPISITDLSLFFKAITVGSEKTTPLDGRYINVLDVPKSIPMTFFILF